MLCREQAIRNLGSYIRGGGSEKRATIQTAVKSAEGPKVNMATESFQVKPVTVISNINPVN